MSDNESEIKPFAIERAKLGRASCKKCKIQCEAGSLRIARVNPNNPFGSGPMKSWYHVECFFQLKKSKNAKVLQRSDEVEGWDLLHEEDKQIVIKSAGKEFELVADSENRKCKNQKDLKTKDNSFEEFQKVVKSIAKEASYNNKSRILRKFLQEGTGKKFEGSKELWLKLLLPKDVDKRVYNLQDKQLVKLFSSIFKQNLQDMIDDLARGDVSQTIAFFFEKPKNCRPAFDSTLTIMEVDQFLEDLQDVTHEAEQIKHFERICDRCSVSDLKTIIRLIKRDLKMNCGARHVLDALHSEAYAMFQKSRDIRVLLNELRTDDLRFKAEMSKGSINLMTPVSPMLAEACKDFDKALKKCPNGFFSEIKYDGERVQIHKKGEEFKFFSRNLKPVLDHKITEIKKYLPKAFPHGNDLIIDSEILMVDTETDELLPFGTLGKHKKEDLRSAEVCLFIFDCLYFNGEDLTRKTIKERRKFLEENVTIIKHHIQLSEYQFLRTKNDLVEMTKTVLKKGLEGLVLKGTNTIYEPGKRRWLKVKKDYLLKGAIADTADLVVLGAWYGTGKMGGQYSIFLMGCFDESSRVWKTVTKVHSGLSDAEMEKIHKKISPIMEKFDGDSKVPKWIKINRSMIPNALALDPMKMPVFEVTGAEFTQSDIHTAGSISIRFPRITKIRNDKSPSQATSLKELKHLYEESKSGANLDELNKLKSDNKGSTNADQPGSTMRMKSEHFNPKKDARSKLPKEIDKKLKRNSTELETDTVAKKVKLSAGIFKDIFLFVPEHSLAERNQSQLQDFIKHGGNMVENSKDATVVVHASREIKMSLEKGRTLYDVNCRHLHISWLHECLKDTMLKSSLEHSVSLHQI